MAELLENGISEIGTVRANRKHMPTVTADKQIKHGEHDWQTCIALLQNGWTTNLSSSYLTNMIQVLPKILTGN